MKKERNNEKVQEETQKITAEKKEPNLIFFQKAPHHAAPKNITKHQEKAFSCERTEQKS